MRYVLRRMVEEEYITQEQMDSSLTLPKEKYLAFKRGKFQFRLSTNMVAVKRAMESEPIVKALAQAGYVDYTATGLKIYTTLHADLQPTADWVFAKELSLSDIRLRGLLQANNKGRSQALSRLDPRNIYRAKVEKVTATKKGEPEIELSFGALKAKIRAQELTPLFKSYHTYLKVGRAHQ